MDEVEGRVFMIKPYRSLDTWVFDDPAVGLVKEPFVLGADSLLDFLTEEIPNSDKGFLLFFSANPMPGDCLSLEWRRKDMDGHWYYCRELGFEAWLCSALHLYYPSAPQMLFFQARSLETNPKQVVKEKNDRVHVALLGDSILDNGAYVSEDELDVRSHLSKLVDDVTLCAIDGSTTANVFDQLKMIPKDVTHIVLSSGGNDALRSVFLLDERADCVGDALLQLSGVIKDFEEEYRRLVGAILSLNFLTRPKLIICTIYNTRYPDPIRQMILTTALRLFNDVIQATALEFGVPVIDLRTVCTDDEDFFNPVEPSGIGGGKIANAINSTITKQMLY